MTDGGVLAAAVGACASATPGAKAAAPNVPASSLTKPRLDVAAFPVIFVPPDWLAEIISSACRIARFGRVRIGLGQPGSGQSGEGSALQTAGLLNLWWASEAIRGGRRW